MDHLEQKAELEVARYRLALAETDDARKAIAAEVDADEKAYAAAVGARLEGIDDTDAVDAVAAGAASVIRLLPVVGSGAEDGDVAVDALGWAVLGGLALLFYRHLDRRASARALGPVKVESDESDLERFRFFVTRNIPDPGTVPGATALQPITDLLATTQVSAAGVLGKIASVLIAIIEQKRGYIVWFKSVGGTTRDVDKASSSAPARKPHSQANGEKAETRIAVRVSDARTAQLISQDLFCDTSRDDAIRKAAYWAAAVVIERSDRVPRWAQWSRETAESLAAFFAEADTGRVDLIQIEEAVRRAPTSGELCLLLSHCYALQGKHLEAFELALRAAALYSHFVAARYRLATAASLVAADMETNWWHKAPEQRERVLFALSRYSASKTQKVRQELKARRQDPTDAITELCKFAIEELDNIRRPLLSAWVVPLNALRRSERAYWLAFLRPNQDGLTGRVQFRRAIDAAKPAIQLRGGIKVKKGITEKWVSDQRTFWQVAYNLACYEAIKYGQGTPLEIDAPTHPATRAVEHLETALERPGSHQLTGQWLKKDPDLETIREFSRFRLFVESVSTDGGPDANKA